MFLLIGIAPPLLAELSVEGTVIGASDSLPIEDLWILAESSNGIWLGTETTDAAGHYEFHDLPDGDIWLYTAHASLNTADDFHVDTNHQGGICRLRGCSAPNSFISVQTGATAPVVDFLLPLGGRIGGSVLNDNGSAMGNTVAVSLYPADGSPNKSFPASSGSGNYLIKQLQPGTYYARTSGPVGGEYIPEAYDDVVCYPNGCDLFNRGTPIVVTAGQTTTADFELTLGGTISGAFVADDTSPVPGAPLSGRVLYYDQDGNFIFNKNVTNGSYTIRGLDTGSYYLQADTSTGYFAEIYKDIPRSSGAAVTDGLAVQVVAGADTTGIDFELATGGSIEGTITNALTNEPATGVGVHWIRVDTRSTDGAAIDEEAGEVTSGTDSNSEKVSHQLATDESQSEVGRGADGSYRIFPLVAGVYRISTRADGEYIDQTHPQDINLGHIEEVTGIDFQLMPAAKIGGKITDSKGAPIPDAYVGLHRLSETDHPRVASAFSDENGDYVLSGLEAADDYFLIASKSMFEATLHPNIYCTFNCDYGAGTLVEVEAGEFEDSINFSLKSAGRIEVTLTEVGTGNQARAGMRAYDQTGALVKSAGADENGVVVFDHLPLDRSYYVLTHFTIGYYFELYNNHPYYFDTSEGQRTDVFIGDALSFPTGQSLIQIAMDLDTAESAPELSGEVFGLPSVDARRTSPETETARSAEAIGKGKLTTTEGFLHCTMEGGPSCATRAFPTNGEAQLLAVPDPGSEFVEFGGDADCLDGVVSMTGDVFCTATFRLLPQLPLFKDDFETGNLTNWE